MHFETITFLHSKCKVSSSIMQPFAEGEIKKRSIYIPSPFYTRYLRCSKPRENAKMQQWLLQTNPNANTEMSALRPHLLSLKERLEKNPNTSNKTHHCISSKATKNSIIIFSKDRHLEITSLLYTSCQK